jgi:sulfate adenylyltransferase
VGTSNLPAGTGIPPAHDRVERVAGERLASASRADELRGRSVGWPSWHLLPAQLDHLELLLNGGFTPLAGFMTRHEAAAVDDRMRLPDGTFWPVPVVLDVSDDFGRTRAVGDVVALRDAEGVLLAALTIADAWQGATGQWYLGGQIEGLQLPGHFDFRALRRTPAEIRGELQRGGVARVLAVFPGHLLHRAHQQALCVLADRLGAGLLIHIAAPTSGADMIEHFERVHALTAAAAALGRHVVVALVPLSDKVVDEAQVCLRAVVARNYGCTHLLVDPDDPKARLEELGPPGLEFVELPDTRSITETDDHVTVDDNVATTGTLTRLQSDRPLRRGQGITVFFTGLSGSGKSTIANALRVRLLETTGRPVTLLDGDLVRKHLSSELGFSREHRDLNILRIGYVASEITRHGGIAICAPIAPYAAVRARVRDMIAPLGGFVLVHVATPVEVCERRDRKGLYAKARAGLLPQFTGVSDPYEAPTDAAITLDTDRVSVDEAVTAIVDYLVAEGHLDSERTR